MLYLNILLMLGNSVRNFCQATGLVYTLDCQPVCPSIDCKGLWPDCPALVKGPSQVIVKDLQGVQVGGGGCLGCRLGDLHVCIIPQKLQQLVTSAAGTS